MLLKSEIIEKTEIILCGIHYFITKLKTKIHVIILSRFEIAIVIYYNFYYLKSGVIKMSL